MSGNPWPTEIKLHRTSRVLEVAFDDGARFRLPCEYLRVYSPSAEVRGHPGDAPKLVLGKERVGITDLRQVGNYAVKLFFDDGHKSGLFDWRYLYRLGMERESLWRDYLERLRVAGYERREDGARP